MYVCMHVHDVDKPAVPMALLGACTIMFVLGVSLLRCCCAWGPSSSTHLSVQRSGSCTKKGKHQVRW